MKETHLEYLEKAGNFSVGSDSDLYNRDELNLITRWGNWYQALTNGKLEPYTEEQKRFAQICKEAINLSTEDIIANIRKEKSPHLKVWLKHLFRIKYKEEHPESQRTHTLDDPSFYTSEDVRRIHQKRFEKWD